MQNLAVPTQLVPPQAKVAANGGSPAPPDASTPGATDDQAFGKLLAKQVAIATGPQTTETVAAILKGDEADDKAKNDAGLDMVAQMALVAPALLPMQQGVANQGQVNTELADTLPALDGKNLPSGGIKPAEIAAGNLLNVAEGENAKAEASHPFADILDQKIQAPDLSSQNGVTAAQLQTNQNVPDKNTEIQPNLSVPQRVDAENWGTGLGDKVVWMVGNQTRGAEIHLNPPALGPLEVRVSINDGQANLSFMTQHGAVREAIEAATPKLREMLADTGISMGNVSVNVGSFAQQQQNSQDQQSTSRSPWHMNGDDTAGTESFATFVQPLRERGMVDYFA